MKELKFTQTRNRFTELSTTSELTLDGKLVCYILEDKDRGLTKSMSEADTAKIKVKKETAIGYGTYEIDLTLSPKFGVWFPLVLGVIGFSGIRIHPGLNSNHTEGCLLPGMFRGIDNVTNSKEAFYLILFHILNHLTLNTTLADELCNLHKLGKSKSKEFGELFTKNRVAGQKIFITITK